MSAYLASIMQERPIVYLLAKHLWRKGFKFELEHKQTDLVVEGKCIEFKMNYNRCEVDLGNTLDRFGDNLSAMWVSVQTGRLNKTWRVGPKIYQDVCIKRPDIFVWIVVSRDLSRIKNDDLARIGLGSEQCQYNSMRPYCSNGDSLVVIDRFLGLLQKERMFSMHKLDIETIADFPSTYHFRICDFSVST
jgi:hypothetical protein